MGALPGKYKLVSVSSGLITTDAGGDATATIAAGIGEIMSVSVALGTSVSADVVLTNEAGATVLSKTGIAADAEYYVRAGAVTNDGTTAITNSFIPYMNQGGDMDVTIANGGDTKTLTVNVMMKV
jgi:hypothetical protein